MVGYGRNCGVRCCKSRGGGSAFTLIEMLVVILIIAILAALLMPSLQQSIETAKGIDCANRMKQLYLGLSMYADDNMGCYPPEPSSHFSSYTWEGTTRTNCWINWTAQNFVGQYVGNNAMVCSAFSAPPKRVSEIIFCSKAPFIRNQPWFNGIGLNSSMNININRVKNISIFGVLCCSIKNSDPSWGWKKITSDFGEEVWDVNGNNYSHYPHNWYVHNDACNITFGDGHVGMTLDAVADQQENRLYRYIP